MPDRAIEVVPEQCDRQLWPGLDHIANFINALDSEGMTAKDVRTAIYAECLEPRHRQPSIEPKAAGGELVEKIARILYACEKERSDRTDAILSAAAGKTVSVGMEPWEECWQVFHSDAEAVLSALRKNEPGL